MRSTHLLRIGLPPLIVAMLLATGCATVSREEMQVNLDSAEVSVRHAEDIRAAEFAAFELANARQNLIAARTALQNGSGLEARKYSLLAKADADLAIAKSKAAQAKAENAKLDGTVPTTQANGGRQ